MTFFCENLTFFHRTRDTVANCYFLSCPWLSTSDLLLAVHAFVACILGTTGITIKTFKRHCPGCVHIALFCFAGPRQSRQSITITSNDACLWARILISLCCLELPERPKVDALEWSAFRTCHQLKACGCLFLVLLTAPTPEVLFLPFARSENPIT
jgi:hypothetical protein